MRLRREPLAETGYRGSMRSVGSHLVSAYSTQTRYVFVAEGATQVAASGEGLEGGLMQVGAFRQHLHVGRLTDVAAGYLALDALGLL